MEPEITAPPSGNDPASTTTPPPAGTGEMPVTPPATWDAWLSAQPEAQRSIITQLHETHTSGLRTSLQSERDERKKIAAQLKDLQGKQEKGSATEAQLIEMQQQLEVANRRADFMAEAIKPEIGLIGAEAAWVLMNNDAESYFDRKGNPNFAKLKEAHPYLFRSQTATPTPRIGAGAGVDAGANSPAKGNMNTFIRQSSGRRG